MTAEVCSPDAPALVRRLAFDDDGSLVRMLSWLGRADSPSAFCDAIVADGVGPRAVELALIARVEGSALALLGGSGTPVEAGIPVAGYTLLARAARERALLSIAGDEARPPASGHAGVDRVLVALPIAREGHLEGVVGLRFRDAGEPCPRTRASLEVLALCFAQAFPRFAALLEERERTRRLEEASARTVAMARISRELAEAGVIEDAILDRAARGVSDLFGDGCLVRMLDGHHARTIAVHHPRPDERGELERLADDSSGRVARGGLVRRVHRRTQLEPPLRKSVPVESMMSAPVVLGGKACFVLVVARTGGPAHTDDDRRLLEDISYRVGLALEVARAYAAEQDARSRAEQAARGRDRVLSVVSHDLRAPLATVHLSASLLAEGDLDAEAHADVVGRITRATQRMRRLVEDLLDLGQLENGLLCVRRERVPLGPLLLDLTDELEPRARASQKSLLCRLPPALEVAGDPQRLQQVLSNLVINALDHTPAGTSVVLGARAELGRAVIWVEDDGPGLESDLLERLFEPHVRGARVTADGAGLGLWIAKRLAEAHEGELRVRSAPGEGTRFELVLPLAPRTSG